MVKNSLKYSLYVIICVILYNFNVILESKVHAESFIFIKQLHNGIVIKLNRFAYAKQTIYGSPYLSFKGLCCTNKPEVAINGNFFCTVTGITLDKYLIIVWDGEVHWCPRNQGFKTLDVTSWVWRSAYGESKNYYYLVVAQTSLYGLATILAGTGAKTGYALDGGSSTGLYYLGQFYMLPNRYITSIIIFRRK